MVSFFQGMGTGAGLIIAIGAQNAFVLSQGVRREYNWLVALICIICDATLIFIGAAGVGTAVAANPLLREVAAWGGAAFLFYYGAQSLYSALNGAALQTYGGNYSSRMAVTIATLGVTLLNPHVYLDTVILLGSISGQHGAEGRYIFALGASFASFLWFSSLSIGGVLLSPFFKSRRAWQFLDLAVCATMWFIAVQLLMM